MYARHSRNRIHALATDSERHPTWKNQLVGRSEVWPISQTRQTVAALHGMAGRGYPRVD